MKNMDNDKINYSDIPELTKEDFAKGKKNPFAGKFKDGYTIVVEHADYEEIITIKKKRQPKKANIENQQCIAEPSRLYND